MMGDAPSIFSALLQGRALSGAKPRDRRGRSVSPISERFLEWAQVEFLRPRAAVLMRNMLSASRDR
jgi:hypothetical protein